jgi:NADH dehydrogenase
MAGKPDGFVEIILIAPEPVLYLRPRLYENNISQALASLPLTELFNAVGIRYVQGSVQRIDVEKKTITYASGAGLESILAFDRLILASGSKLFRPKGVKGLAEYSWDIDQMDGALKLDAHLKSLAALPDSPARNTVVVCGGGFTGVEVAAEMPQRLRAILGVDINVVILEQSDNIGSGMAPAPRPIIKEALNSLGVDIRTGQTVVSVDADGVTTASGLRIASKTVIWTAGMRAEGLTAQIPAERDHIGRLHVTPDLNVVGVEHVYATGDTAHVAVDEEGHLALMCCQHALYMGKAAGHNAMGDLLGLPPAPYRKPQYAMSLALGPWGALETKGWDYEVTLVKEKGQEAKMYVNTQVIYPPAPTRAAVFAAADPGVQYKLY